MTEGHVQKQWRKLDADELVALELIDSLVTAKPSLLSCIPKTDSSAIDWLTLKERR